MPFTKVFITNNVILIYLFLLHYYFKGYEKYNVMRADRKLAFRQYVGPPDERALLAEIEVEPE